MSNAASVQWSDERVADQFKLEVRQRFEGENARCRAKDIADLARLSEAPDWEMRMKDPSFAAGMTVRDSFFWDLYSGATISYEYNSVQVVLPNSYAIYPDFIEMFRGTSVAWGLPNVKAKIIDGEPRVVIDVLLVDYWDDERAAKHLEEVVRKAKAGEPNMTPIQQIIAGLRIFESYLSPKNNPGGFSAGHDEIWVVGVHRDAVGGDDREKLQALGWAWNASHAAWSRYV